MAWFLGALLACLLCYVTALLAAGELRVRRLRAQTDWRRQRHERAVAAVQQILDWLALPPTAAEEAGDGTGEGAAVDAADAADPARADPGLLARLGIAQEPDDPEVRAQIDLLSQINESIRQNPDAAAGALHRLIAAER